MTTIAFDTGAFQGVHDKAELATQQELQIELAPLKADLTLVKWMLGLMLGVVRHCSLRHSSQVKISATGCCRAQ